MDLLNVDRTEIPMTGLASRSEPAEVLPTAEIQCMAAALVGRVGWDDVQHRVKRAMLAEALARTSGNLSRTAVLLGVRRQAVQQMLSRYEMRPLANEARHELRYD
jgi:DNA-binding NtrC family response regulator